MVKGHGINPRFHRFKRKCTGFELHGLNYTIVFKKCVVFLEDMVKNKPVQSNTVINIQNMVKI